MAKILPFLGELSGSARGLVFSHNKGGAYVRGRTIPTNPTTLKQSAVRAILATLSSSWSGLTAGQRAEWAMWAELNPVVNSLGQSIQRTGQQAYVGLNTRLLQAGAAAVVTCPDSTGPGDLTTATAVATAPGSIVVTYTVTPLAAGQRLVLWSTLPQTVGRNPNRNQARLIGYTAAAAASPQTFASPYPALATQVSNLWVAVMDDAGQVSPGKRISATWV